MTAAQALMIESKANHAFRLTIKATKFLLIAAAIAYVAAEVTIFTVCQSVGLVDIVQTFNLG